MKYIIYYEGEEIPAETQQPLEDSGTSEGLPGGETVGETETTEDAVSENIEGEEEQENSENTTYEVIDFSDQLQTIAETAENMRDLIHAAVIMLAIMTLFLIIYEFFRGVAR